MDPVFYMLLGALATPMVYLVADFYRTFLRPTSPPTTAGEWPLYCDSDGKLHYASAHREALCDCESCMVELYEAIRREERA